MSTLQKTYFTWWLVDQGQVQNKNKLTLARYFLCYIIITTVYLFRPQELRKSNKDFGRCWSSRSHEGFKTWAQRRLSSAFCFPMPRLWREEERKKENQNRKLLRFITAAISQPQLILLISRESIQFVSIERPTRDKNKLTNKLTSSSL